MPRVRRLVRPSALLHVIVRFLNGEFLLDSPSEREEYLRRARNSFVATDWVLLAYALMSSHVHLAAIAGYAPFADIGRPLHCGFAGWLNPRRGRLGPVLAGRPTTDEVEPGGARALIAYIHNNPVRAGIVATAADSSWTSHRAYLGLDRQPTGLHVVSGLQVAGFNGSPVGRAAFGEAVDAAALESSTGFESVDAMETRKTARRLLGPSIEVGSAVIDESAAVAQHSLWSPVGGAISRTWSGDAVSAVARVVAEHGVTLAEIQSKSRRRALCRIRRIATLCCHSYLGLPLNAVAAALGISAEAARQLELSADETVHHVARRLAAAVWDPGTKT